MPRICHTIYFKRPPKEVFGYVTTAANWVKWHPVTQKVWGDIQKPSRKGDEVVELVKTGGLEGFVVWKITQCKPPSSWKMETQIITLPLMSAGQAKITYKLTSQKGGTKFQRIFDYELPKSLFLFDWIYFRRRQESESKKALDRLKRFVEKGRSS